VGPDRVLRAGQGAELREILDRYVDAEFKADWEAAVARLGEEVLARGGISKEDLDRTDAQRRADALVKIFRDAAAADGSAVPVGWVHNIHWSAAAYEEMLAAMDHDVPHGSIRTRSCVAPRTATTSTPPKPQPTACSTKSAG
jgi:hypothetical protein